MELPPEEMGSATNRLKRARGQLDGVIRMLEAYRRTTGGRIRHFQLQRRVTGSRHVRVHRRGAFAALALRRPAGGASPVLPRRR